MHLPIEITNFELSVTGRVLIADFSVTIYPGSKIGIIGDNGSGKSSLLSALYQAQFTVNPAINLADGITLGYVPQLIAHESFSGGERFNNALSQALANFPELLLLDEPTNHLDGDNRRALFKLLRHNPATMLIVSHDPELLNNYVDCLWHVHDGKVTVFNGNYSDYCCQLERQRDKLYRQIDTLKTQQKQQHQSLMKEQQRAKNSRLQGEKHISERKWPTITSGAKARRAETTAGKNSAKIKSVRQDIQQQLDNLWQPEELSYSFGLVGFSSTNAVVTIVDGRCGYLAGDFSLTNINLNLSGNSRVALCGDNGSGKTSLLRAIIRDPQLWIAGEWLLPPLGEVSYLDQHYSSIEYNATVLEMASRANPDLTSAELRAFLNRFLFRKNEEVSKTGAILSGGEKARLSLALIALRRPKLLIIDEISNNIDLTTRNHIISVLRDYPGAMLIISHDREFLEQLAINDYYNLS